MKDDVRQWLSDQFGDDGETIAAVWGEYLSSSASKLAEARAALAESDFPRLDHVAHTLKGNALMVGDQTFASVAIALREATKSSDADTAARLIDRLAALDQENRA